MFRTTFFSFKRSTMCATFHVKLRIRDAYANTASSVHTNRESNAKINLNRGKKGGTRKGVIQRRAGRRRQRSDVVKLTHSSANG